MILTKVTDRIATLAFNRPDKLNALSTELLESAIETLEGWSTDPNIGVVVVTGIGRAFCAGGDVSSMAKDSNQSLEESIDRLRSWQELSWLLYSMPKVTIAAVNGFAMGAGLGISLACDLRIASDQAKFGTAYAKVGFGGDFGTTWLLTRYAGAAKAKELLFLADPIDAAEAHRLGLVNRVVAQDQFETEVTAWATRIAAGPLTSYRYMKANVNLATHSDFRTILDREAETHLRCGQTADHKEGVTAFLEKRVATITLNRPDKLNAYSEVMVHEILTALADARDDDAIRAVIITGAGRGFCSGGDVSRDFQYPSRYRGHRLESMLEMRENMDQLVTFLQRFDKPVIAAVNGPAVAGGLTLALACDFRIAAASAKLGDTSLRFGLIPDEGGAHLFPKFMGLERALKMSLFSEVYPARQAKELGLVTEVVADSELMSTARRWAERLADGPPLAIRITKRMMYKQQTMSLENALEDAALSTLAVNYTDDVKEGIKAFHEKRKPDFKGR